MKTNKFMIKSTAFLLAGATAFGILSTPMSNVKAGWEPGEFPAYIEQYGKEAANAEFVRRLHEDMKAEWEAKEAARIEAERIAREQEEAALEEEYRLELERLEKLINESAAKKEAERMAQEQAQAEAKAKAQAEAKAKAEAEAKAQAEAKAKAEAEAKAQAEAKAKAEAEAKAQETVKTQNTTTKPADGTISTTTAAGNKKEQEPTKNQSSSVDTSEMGEVATIIHPVTGKEVPYYTVDQMRIILQQRIAEILQERKMAEEAVNNAAAKTENKIAETTKAESSKTDNAKTETTKTETAKVETTKLNTTVTTSTIPAPKPVEVKTTEEPKVVDKKEEMEKQAVVKAFMEQYPNGTSWDDDMKYSWKAKSVYGSGYGCAAFAMKLSDEIYGNQRAKKITDGSLEVYDMVGLLNGTHYALVLSIDEAKGIITVAEGNVGGKVRWGAQYYISDISSTVRRTTESRK